MSSESDPKLLDDDDSAYDEAQKDRAKAIEDFHTDMPVGEILRRTRVYYGQSPQQIEQIIRIRASNLEALENGEIDKLPGRVYAIGFIRAYAEYLGLDGDKMVHLFKKQMGEAVKPKVDLSFPVPAEESKIPNLYVIGGSAFGAIVLLVFIAFFLFPDKKTVDIPSIPETMTGASLSDAPALIGSADETAKAKPEVTNASGTQANEAPEQQQATTSPTSGPSGLVLVIKESSWIEIKTADGKAILRKVLKPGDMYLVPPEQGLTMTTGNAGGVVFQVNGKELAPIGQSGEIRRNISLDASSLQGQ